MLVETSVLSSWVCAIYRTIQSYGVLPDALLEQAGIEKETLLKHNERIPAENSNALWSLAAEATGDPLIGLHVPGNMTLNTLYSVDAAAQASSSFGEFIRCACRFSTIVTNAVKLDLSQDRDICKLNFRQLGDIPLCHQAVDAYMTVVCMTAEPVLNFSEFDYPLFTQINVTRPKPKDVRRYESCFPCEINYGCDQNSVYLDARFMDQKLPSANPEFLRFSERMFTSYLSRVQCERFEEKVRRVIVYLLDNNRLSKENAAYELNMSARNLTRRLNDIGVTFSQLVDVIRQERALRLIGQKNLSLGEIAYLLGFMEVNSFIRAFRRWTGVTPGHYRSEILIY